MTTPTTETAPQTSFVDPETLKKFALPGVFLVLIAITTIISPSFLSISNMQDVLTQAAPLMIVVIGQTLVILVRGLDLSVASLMATVAVMATAFNTQDDAMIPVIFASAIVFCMVVGFINGWLVTKRNVSPFLATLAMMIVLQGLRFYYTQGAPAGVLPEGFRFLGTGQILGIPTNMIGFLILFIGLSFMLHKTVFGRKVYIVGGNPSSADLVGINSHNVTITCYVLCSVLAGIAGLLLVGFVGTVDNFVGQGYELDSIVAAVVGGVALSGGKGNLFGAVMGALILVLLFNIVVIIGLPVQAQMVIKGVIIVAAAAYFARSLKSS